MPASQPFCQDLFAGQAPAGPAHRIEMRLLRKRGHPFLLLPHPPRAAASLLELYPAQTAQARLLKTGLRILLRARLAFRAETLTLNIPDDSPLRSLLARLAGTATSDPPPTFGLLAGNPSTPGQRFLILVFDTQQQPVAVVKAGLTERARELIQQEISFLTGVPKQVPGIPALRDTLQRPELAALALDFVPGHSPRPVDLAAAPALLGSWLDRTRQISLGEASAWRRLVNAGTAPAWLARFEREHAEQRFHPAIFHGDFAPWNIKVSPAGNWTVLDWERGELAGLPAWDWFHLELQPAILVERLPTDALLARLTALLCSEPFQQYARLAGIVGWERGLALAYLRYGVEILKPAEGLAATQALLAAAAAEFEP